jgi:putative PIN family toxin of toxin-antitoxin system
VLRVVLDANVFVSAYIRPEGPPGQIIERFVRDGAFEVVLTEPIVEEVLESLSYPKVQKATRSTIDPALWFEDIVVLSQLVAGDVKLPRLCSDADDDKYVAAAVEGRAPFVVTGDPDLLTIAAHEGIRIITPRAFLDLLNE